jgi:hypothetical protein
VDYSATSLLAMIRDATGTGTDTRDWGDQALLRTINRMVGSYLVPFILKARKNHFATSIDIPLQPGVRSYLLPSGAVGQKIRAVQLVDQNGNPSGPLQERDLEDAVGLG